MTVNLKLCLCDDREFETVDDAMEETFNHYPLADFSLWNEDNKSEWIDVFVNNDRSRRVGRIIANN